MAQIQKIGFMELLEKVQQYISQNYSAALSDKSKTGQLKSYINKYLYDNRYEVEGYDNVKLAHYLYREMAEYSVLTDYLGRDDVEEINVNGWDDIAITYTNGQIIKTEEHFASPQHAVDIVKRLLQHSGMLLDEATPMAQGHLPGNTRITALKTPLVDDDRGVAVSIRLLHQSKINMDQIVAYGTATRKMMEFLCMCLNYGISFVFAGATSSGKTSSLNALLATIPDNKRVYSIESGARELSLIRRDENGKITNNVVHTISKSSENEKYDVSQEKLVVAALRFDPDIVVVGEMRDTEAYSAVEASLTGHTVVSTIHAYTADRAHTRLALLTQKKFPIEFQTSMMQAAQAFPIVIYQHKLEDSSRKIMDISECVVDDNGNRHYHSLFKYCIDKNERVDGKSIITGHFEQPNLMSEELQKRLQQFGAPADMVEKFMEKGAEYGE